ncbi:MAG TPA: glycosyl hydrolase family 18 protein [Pseudonocardiaceae bacterium]
MPPRLLRLASGLALAVGLSLLVAPSATAAPATATFTKTSDWGTGWEGRYVITNGTTSAINGWRVEVDVPSGVVITSAWDTQMTRNGNHYTFANLSWNSTIQPGATASFGFNGTRSVPFTEPANCTLNGAPCGGGTPPPPDTQAPTVPGSLRVTGTTSNSVSLAWNASTDNVGVTGYDVTRTGAAPVTVTGTSTTIGGLNPSTAYSFTVRARDAAGNLSGVSNQVSATTPSGPPPPPPGTYKKVGYFAQWGVYARNYKVKEVQTSGAAGRLTHINYAFGNVNEQGLCFQANAAGVGDAWADYQRRFTAAESVDGVADVYNQPLAGNLNQLKKLKAANPNLKVMISLGGWTWSRWFSNAALTAASRQAFASSCIDMWIKGNLPVFGGEPQGGPGSAFGVFDGIDIDWEWPASEGNVGNVVRPQDKQNFTLMLAELRRQLDAYGATVGRRYELSAFLPADPNKIAAGIEIGPVFSQLDFATVQGYDFHGAWENRTNHQAQLRSPAANPAPIKFSVENAVNVYRAGGAPARELVIGVPAYGRGWAGVGTTNNGLYQPSSGPAPGTWEAGVEDYKVLATRPGTRYRDATNGALYLYANGQFWSYDDPQLMVQKANWIKSNGLGGSMVWSLDGDDSQASLVTALHTTLGT